MNPKGPLFAFDINFMVEIKIFPTELLAEFVKASKLKLKLELGPLTSLVLIILRNT